MAGSEQEAQGEKMSPALPVPAGWAATTSLLKQDQALHLHLRWDYLLPSGPNISQQGTGEQSR